ncbi:hypothetical protein Syun_021895 [Stephania yunnanensis]|uniref:Rhodanese domain-containing protein n=1 Tax=Stephania yunnanensis TaxID=152371 RepID=A0AAP0IHF9_9MAGN
MVGKAKYEIRNLKGELSRTHAKPMSLPHGWQLCSAYLVEFETAFRHRVGKAPVNRHLTSSIPEINLQGTDQKQGKNNFMLLGIGSAWAILWDAVTRSTDVLCVSATAEMTQGFAFALVVSVSSSIAFAHPPRLPIPKPSSSSSSSSSSSPLLHIGSNIRSRRSPILQLQLKPKTLISPISASSSTTTTTTTQSSLLHQHIFVVVNFYCFVFIKDPEELVAEHLSFLQGRDVRGRIYVNEQGINAQYSGPSADALAYVEWLKEGSRFSDILVQISPALDGHAFPRLKLRYKPSLLEGGISHLPLHDLSMRATPLAPFEWRKKLEAVNNVNEAPGSHLDKKFILLDVRNGYEWDIGHFRGAHRPNVDCFRSTSFGLSEPQVEASDPLAGVDKENTQVLMYCTGGIRCDIYSVILRKKGFHNLFTLKGGVSHYLEKEGPVEWTGNLFVFDSRLSLPPSAYKPDVVTQSNSPQEESDTDTFARCYICRSHLSELRHRNCANLDCNRLYLCCPKCLSEVQGCCCSNCKSAPRLRPVLPGFRRYDKWHLYRDMELENPSVA